MKKFVVLISIAAFLSGLRLMDNGLLNINAKGMYTEFFNGGKQITYNEAETPLLDRFSGYTRLDTSGSLADAKKGLEDLNAKILWQEEFDGGSLVILYAYTPNINDYETVLGKRVNVMVAVKDGNISYGSPLLKGSY